MNWKKAVGVLLLVVFALVTLTLVLIASGSWGAFVFNMLVASALVGALWLGMELVVSGK